MSSQAMRSIENRYAAALAKAHALVEAVAVSTEPSLKRTLKVIAIVEELLDPTVSKSGPV